MYSIEDRYTFENLQEWIENAQDSVPDIDSFVWAVVGNKCDLPLEIERESIKARCDQLGTTLNFFVSAKTGENVATAFDKTLEYMYRRKAADARTEPDSGTVRVQEISSRSDSKPPCKC